MTISRRALIAAAAALTAVSAASAQGAGAGAKFTLAAFETAQAAGKPIIVEVTAPWCPTCRAQQPIINSLAAKPEYRNVTILKVDFDSQKDVLRALKVTQQSTIIAFKGKAETGRSTGDTTAAGIEGLFKSSI